MNDRRVSKSKKNIENAFFSLLESKPVESITIRELCEKAEISRSTFYDHYEDYLTFLSKLENRAVDLMLAPMKLYDYDTDTSAMGNALFESLKANYHLYAFIFNDKLNIRAKDLFITRAKELSLS